MNIEELKKRYESVCDEINALIVSFIAHKQFNTFGKTIDEMNEFHKSLNKVELNLRLKNDEKICVMGAIQDLNSQNIRDELNRNRIKCND